MPFSPSANILQPDKTLSASLTSDELIARMQLIDHLGRWMEETGLSNSAIAQWKFNALAAAYPNDSMVQSVCSTASSLLGTTQPLPEVGMNVTEIASLLSDSLEQKIKPADVNNALVDLGYQVRHSEQRIWELTSEGREHGISLLSTSKTNSWSGPNVKWYSSILPILEDYFKNSNFKDNGQRLPNGKNSSSNGGTTSSSKEVSSSASRPAKEPIAKTTTESKSWFLSERLKFLKIKTTADQLMHLEMELVAAYREKYGKLPSKQLYKQKQCDVFQEEDLEIVDSIIQKVMARYKI